MRDDLLNKASTFRFFFFFFDPSEHVIQNHNYFSTRKAAVLLMRNGCFQYGRLLATLRIEGSMSFWNLNQEWSVEMTPELSVAC